MQITLEGTHHGPVTNKPTMFIEIGESSLGFYTSFPVCLVL
jgi:D-tyrosyl-tRNA(Tyr) deacylase